MRTPKTVERRLEVPMTFRFSLDSTPDLERALADRRRMAERMQLRMVRTRQRELLHLLKTLRSK